MSWFNSAAQAAPTISISQNSSTITISFSGTLEGADLVTGPWTELADATSPLGVEAANARRFYRTRETGSIFSGGSPLRWTLTGPFQEHFGLAFAGVPDGIFPPVRLTPWFEAEFKMDALELPVTMRVRGNSSLQECSFPKLKMKVSKEHRENTPFEDAREIKIGTHCAEGGRGNIGRLRDERAAWREALAYETMHILGFTSPRVRRAILTYQDSGEAGAPNESGWRISRHAFVLEDVELVASALGARPLSDEEIAAIRGKPFDGQLITDLELLHALLGNWDFSLDAEGEGIWNTEVVELADSTLLPLAGDFDLASWVTEVVRPFVPDNYYPELGEVERQARYTLENLLARVGPDSFAAGCERFLQHRGSIEAHITTAQVDDSGRANVLRHVSAFFDGVSAVLSGSEK